MFNRKGQFKIKKEAITGDLEELEFELIDSGLDSMEVDEDEITLLSEYEEYGNLQKALEEKGIEVDNAELVRIPTHTKSLEDSQVDDVIKLIDMLEEDDDVANIFHNMDMSE